MELHRHDAAYLTERGIEQALASVEPELTNTADAGEAESILRTVPGIVRFQDGETGEWVKLGFPSPERRDGVRLRVAASVDGAEIRRLVTPWEIPDLPPELMQAAGDYGLRLGLFGSRAMERLTGLPYAHPDSDWDLITEYRAEADLRSFYERCVAFCGEGKTDLELFFPGRGSVKAAEWFGPSRTLLLRSLRELSLVTRESLTG